MIEVYNEVVDTACKITFSFDNQVNQFKRSVAKKVIQETDSMIRYPINDVMELVFDEVERSLDEVINVLRKKHPMLCANLLLKSFCRLLRRRR